jgi:uncharacterized membrane protein
MIRRAILSGTALLSLLSAAYAELSICNRTSYIMDVAFGLEQHTNVSTRGWFRIDPGQCRKVVDGGLDADMVYLHARTRPLYGSAPLPQRDDAELCVHAGDFTLADARSCPLSQQVNFAAARPADSPNGPTVNLAEEADYDGAQAQLAGMQRLLTIAGYDAYPIDGVQGTKTQIALARFLKDRNLPADAPSEPEFFNTLLQAAQDPAGPGFSWCNDTNYVVMASLGVVEMGAIVTRGWYRVGTGRCLRPEVRGAPHRLYSYGEAVDNDGRTVKHDGSALTWGGPIQLCTRDGKFELSDHKDCAGRGLNTTGFAAIDMTAQPSTTVRFKDQ